MSNESLDSEDHTHWGLDDSVLAELISQLSEKIKRGEIVNLDDVIRQNPQYANPLKRILPTMGLMARAAERVNPESSTSFDPLREGGGTLGDYELIREIGRGGMGIVYEARQLSLERSVALKVLPLGATMDPRNLKRFQIEAQAAATLHHSNIVPIFAVGCERGVPYYAMQLIDGRSLEEVIQDLRRSEVRDHKTEGDSQGLLRTASKDLRAGIRGSTDEQRPEPLASGGQHANADAPKTAPSSSWIGHSTRDRRFIQSVARLGIQAAEALDYAHEQGVIHRDIKPANMLVDASGRLWITDFGLARVRENGELTAPEDIVGTWRYMSPEQARLREVVIDGRTDIYSLAVTLYELLTLRPAIIGRSRTEILHRIADMEPARPRRLNPAIPQDLEIVLLKAMAKDRAERYGSARNFAQDLQNVVALHPIHARRPSFVDRLTKWTRRHALLCATAAATLALTSIGLSIFIWRIGGLERDARLLSGVVTRQRDQARIIARDLETKSLVISESSSFLLLDRGIDACQRGDVNFGMLLFAEALKMAPRESAALREAIRANLANWRVHAATLNAIIPTLPHVYEVAHSDDGKSALVASVTPDHTAFEAKFWDLANDRELGTIQGTPEAGPTLVAGSLSGDKIFAVGSDGVGQVWSMLRGEPIGPPIQTFTSGFETTAVFAESRHVVAALSPNGDRVLVRNRANSWQIVEADTGIVVKSYEYAELGARVGSLAWSSDGRFVASAADLPTPPLTCRVDVWAATSDTERITAAPPAEDLCRIARFSTDGASIVLGGNLGKIPQWDSSSGNEMRQLQLQVSPVLDVSSDDVVVAAVTVGGRVHFYDPDESTPSRIVGISPTNVLSANLAGGRHVLLGFNDGMARRFRIESIRTGLLPLGGAADLTNTSFPHATIQVLFSPDGMTIIGVSDQISMVSAKMPIANTALLDARSLGRGVQWVSIPSSGGAIIVQEHSNDSNAAWRHHVSEWDLATRTRRRRELLEPDAERVGAIISSNGKRCLTWSRTRSRMLDLATGNPIGDPIPHVPWAHDSPSVMRFIPCAFNSRANLLVMLDTTRRAKVYDANNTRQVSELSATARLAEVAFAGTQAIVSLSDSNSIQLWDATTGRLIRDIVSFPKQIANLSVVEGRDIIAFSDSSGAIHLWHLTTGRSIGPAINRRKPLEPAPSSIPRVLAPMVSALAMSPNGRQVAACYYGYGGEAHLIDIAQLREGTDEQVMHWVEALTGCRLDEHGRMEWVERKTWNDLRARVVADGWDL